MQSFSDIINSARYQLPGETQWSHVVDRVVNTIFDPYPDLRSEKNLTRHLMLTKKFIPSGRILRNTGLPYHQLSSCFLFSAEDSREGWGKLNEKATLTLMSGGGIGVNYGAIRPRGSPLKSTGGVASGPCPLIKSVNELGRGVQDGGFRRSAIYASIPWDHPDVFEFILLKDWPSWLLARKEFDINTIAPCDMTNMSVSLNQEFFDAFENILHHKHEIARNVYSCVVASMCTHGEPGFQIDLDNQTLRNACTEIISADDGDACILGHANLASLNFNELELVAAMQSLFLLLCTEYTDQPTSSIRDVQRRNRRLGAGIMGIGEWFLKRELPYGANDIDSWVREWSVCVDMYATHWAGKLGFPRPVATRAIAPTGKKVACSLGN